MRILINCMAVLFFVCAAEAEDSLRADFILPHCKAFADQKSCADADKFLQGFCAGTMQSVFTHGASLQIFCPPPSTTNADRSAVTIRQMIRVAIAYMENHPQWGHEYVGKLALWSFTEAWPCLK
jgi:hypothetical protein